jgi:hypothetical protein
MKKASSGAVLVFIVLTLPAAAHPSRVGTRARCPRGALRLSARNPIAPATTAALARETNKAHPQVQRASIAWADAQRGGQVKLECGAAVARRTVVVYITRRAYFPSESLMQGVDFVSRFASGYRVWEVAH